jgi:hypothetical protein
MFHRTWIGAALVATLSLSVPGAKAEEAKYPNWEGQWKQGSPVDVWDPSKPPGLSQQPPLTPEYQKMFQATLAWGDFDMKGTCGPVGMPRVMTLYEPMEIVIRPKTTYMLLESMSPIRRIYTDGRDWPTGSDPQFTGYSIGTWLDTDGDGIYDTLEVETRDMRGPRLFDSTGIRLHADNETVVKEKIYIDKDNPDILRNDITTYDHALTKPWTVSRLYRREHNPIYKEYPCTEDYRSVTIGGELYMADGEGHLMSIQKAQGAPDPKDLQIQAEK